MAKKRPYEIFSGEDLKIAEKIQQRRLQMLVHSRIYYVLDKNIVPDATWAKWGKELQALQEQYPKIAKKVLFHDEFAEWDGSSGVHLPLENKWVVKKADMLLRKAGV